MGCQDYKDFNMEINNVRYYLMLNKYPQEFIDSIMKCSKSSHPYSDKIYQGTIIISYIKVISEKLTRIGNRFEVRTILKDQFSD
jgi:hypothetical protein